MMHDQHPTQASESQMTAPVSGSRRIAPVMQASMHGASSQCLHWSAKDTRPMSSTLTADAAVSRSRRKALMIRLDFECFTRQLISQSLHPRQ
jgi:hypothetical protein